MDFKLKRYIINDKGIVTVYDKKTWNWGGVFCFKNTDIAITESLYEALLWVARLLISSMRLYLDIDDRGASIKSLILVCLAFIILN